MIKQHIFLVGPMGVGKTTVGRQLADLLGRPFIDVDSEIERRCGADIQWIFDMEGEKGFRARETNILKDIVSSNKTAVIATGGGAVLMPANRELLRSTGRVVYLSVSKKQLYERMSKDKTRPLLQVDNREQGIDQLIEERDPLYREVADTVFTAVDGGSSVKVAKSLLEVLGED